jgi:hypothetical protein
MRNAIAATLLAATFAGLAACERDVAAEDTAMLRHQVDPTRNRSWWLTREGVVVQTGARSKRVSVSLPDWIWVEAGYSCPPDLALGPKGEAVITSNVVSTVWKVDPETLAASAHPLALSVDADKDVGLAALVYSAQETAFFAYSAIQGSFWKIDAQLKTAQKIARSDVQALRDVPCTDMKRRLGHLVFNNG